MSFHCEKCSKTFTGQRDLNTHINRKTPCIDLNENTGDYICTFCNNSFSTQFNLSRHTNRCIVRKNPSLLLKLIEQKDEIINQQKNLLVQKEEIINQQKEILAHNNELLTPKKDIINQQEDLLEQQEKTIDQQNELLAQQTIVLNQFKKLEEKLTNGDTESSELIKNNNYVYIVKEREFIKTNESIYKIGQTSKGPFKRISQYPKGSVVMALIKVPNSLSYEKEIKKAFNKKFKQCKDIGYEYYEASFKSLFDGMVKIVTELDVKK